MFKSAVDPLYIIHMYHYLICVTANGYSIHIIDLAFDERERV